KLQSLINPGDCVASWIRHTEGLRVAPILIRLHAQSLALVAEHGHFALARFSRATLEGVHSLSFEIPAKFFGVRVGALEDRQSSQQEQSNQISCSIDILEGKVHKLWRVHWNPRPILMSAEQLVG